MCVVIIGSSSFQFSGGEYVSIYDGSNLQSPMISHLDGKHRRNQWHTDLVIKSISSSGDHMLVQYVSNNHQTNSGGFYAQIHHTPIDPICGDWLNFNSGFLISPEYPTMDCSWVITAPSIGDTISIQFPSFEVKSSHCCFMIVNYMYDICSS